MNRLCVYEQRDVNPAAPLAEPPVFLRAGHVQIGTRKTGFIWLVSPILRSTY